MENTRAENTYEATVRLSPEKIRMVSGGISRVCSADGGEHNWITISKDGHTAKCSKCHILCTR